MAAPRVFISSTIYDLKQVRNNIGDFIKSLGYEPVMHERAGVAYSQITPLENDCYHELASCDIVVCIIGNHFGSQSLDNDLSITMNEIQNAIKNKKKVYIFIANDVYTEHRTYLLNKDSGTFKSAYTDDIRIHEFIAELNKTVKNHVIMSFETTDQIISILKAQFAGLLQNLLQREASMTDAKTAYDLQESADRMKEIINDFERQKDDIFTKFDSMIFINNRVAFTIKTMLGMEKSAFFAADIDALDEFMLTVGFSINEVDNPLEDERKYVKDYWDKTTSIILKQSVVNENKTFSKSLKKEDFDKGIIFNVEDKNDDDLPF